MLSSAPFEVPPYLLDMARDLPPVPMAIVGAGHPVSMESARRAAQAGLIDPVLIGEEAVVRDLAGSMEWAVDGLRIIDAGDEARAADTAAALARGGEVAALMKGHVHTDTIMRAALKRDAGLRTERRVSHAFHMTVPGRDRVLYITDAVVNVSPDVDAKIDIVHNAVAVARALGNTRPKVAMLSGTEVASDAMPSSRDAEEVVRRADVPAEVGGPFGFDNAVSPEAAQLKGVDSPVAGNADILVVPNLESGNFLFKQMVYFMSATAAGVTLGLKVPMALTSRADPPEARLAAAAIAVIASRDRPG